MSPDKEEKFDLMLGRALQKHTVPVPPDFTDKVLSRITAAQEQKVLARVILQQRLALAASITIAAAVITLMLVFPETATAFSATIKDLRYIITTQSVPALKSQWQLLSSIAVAAVAVLLSNYDLRLAGNH